MGMASESMPGWRLRPVVACLWFFCQAGQVVIQEETKLMNGHEPLILLDALVGMA
jgi:hypothetical protein